MFSRKKVEYRKEDPAQFFEPKTVISCALAWVLPGAGHFYLGRRREAYLLFGILMACFVLGLAHGGDIFPIQGEGVIRSIGAFCQMGFGVVHLVARLMLDRGTPLSLTYDYGTTYFLIAGMINWLAVIDSFDIAMERK
ncbi:MAG: hypothetical protein KDC35_17875 [Acidobacteria bacterium]|nr:hypothetical protein [Acidobacteriota bacterium]